MVDLPQPEGPTMRPMFQGFSSMGRLTFQLWEDVLLSLCVPAVQRSKIPAICWTRGESSIELWRVMVVFGIGGLSGRGQPMTALTVNPLDFISSSSSSW